jgi:hypothetical protein
LTAGNSDKLRLRLLIGQLRIDFDTPVLTTAQTIITIQREHQQQPHQPNLLSVSLRQRALVVLQRRRRERSCDSQLARQGKNNFFVTVCVCVFKEYFMVIVFE